MELRLHSRGDQLPVLTGAEKDLMPRGADLLFRFGGGKLPRPGGRRGMGQGLGHRGRKARADYARAKAVAA